MLHHRVFTFMNWHPESITKAISEYNRALCLLAPLMAVDSHCHRSRLSLDLSVNLMLPMGTNITCEKGAT